MRAGSSIAIAGAILLALFLTGSMARAVSHTSIFTTTDLSSKQPLDVRSGARLISIAADGLVTIQIGADSKFTARGGELFRDANGRGPGTRFTLVSVDRDKESVVIRYETRVYPIPPKPPSKPTKPK